MIAYKLFRLKPNGKITPLFIDKQRELPIGKWLDSEFIPTKGFAERQGWHCCLKPHAPHLKMDLKSGEKRGWATVKIEDFKYYNRPESQGGTWVLADKMKILHLNIEDWIDE